MKKIGRSVGRLLGEKARRIAVLFLLMASLSNAGCGSLNPFQATPTPTAAPTPEPTPLVATYRATPSEMCLVATLPGIQTEKPQGDLLAWSPITDTLAYVAQDTRARWFSGSLNLASAPKFSKPRVLVENISGDLSWSPSGRVLAFFTLRSEDDLYTIEVVNADGTGLLDLFPGVSAKMDAWSSPKAVAGWDGESTLKVWVSCGSSCVQTVTATLPDGLLTAEGAPIPGNKDIWALSLKQPSKLPKRYPPESRPNWSEDSKKVAYIDEDGNVWVALPDEEVQFMLESGPFLEALETRWSHRGDYLAVRAGEEVRIYSAHCGE